MRGWLSDARPRCAAFGAAASSGSDERGCRSLRSSGRPLSGGSTTLFMDCTDKTSYASAYQSHLDALVAEHGYDRAMELVVGGDFVAFGESEASAVRRLGLRPSDTLIDVGCGSGRLAFALREYLRGRLIGTDVVPDLLRYAEAKCARPDWTFRQSFGPSIPAPPESADMVTFFSVFTHLLDEDIFKFLREARRVLKPGGKAVFSFLDFDCEAHWQLFRSVVVEQTTPTLNRFVTKGVMRRLARGAGLYEVALFDGPERWIALDRALVADNGQPVENPTSLGQSVAVFQRFPERSYLARYPDVDKAVGSGTFGSGEHHYVTAGADEGRTLTFDD